MIGQPLAQHPHVVLEKRQPVLVVDGRGRVEGRHHGEVAGLVEAPAELRHALLGPQNELRCEVAQADYDIWPDLLKIKIEIFRIGIV